MATVIALTVAWRRRPVPLLWGIAAGLAVAVAVAVATAEYRTIRSIDVGWPVYARRLATDAGAALAARVGAVQAQLSLVAAAAATGDGTDEFGSASPGREERAVVTFREGRPWRWSGPVRALPDAAARSEPVGLVTSPFYLAIHSTVGVRTDTAVAMALVHAAEPADRLAPTIAADVAARTGVSGFSFAPARASDDPEDFRVADAHSVTIGPPDAPLFIATPIVPDRATARLRAVERARLRVGGILALALAIFVLAAWRAERALVWRAGALAVALGCTAVAPLNDLSNLTRLFDSAVYFTPIGGPLTGNAGALLLTSVLVLLGLLALVRGDRGRLGRPAAIAGVLLVAGAGPFLLRDLARGIQIPPAGVDAGLWLVWEVPLFLAAVCVLLAGATAGGAALGEARGVPPTAGPLLALAAALLAPVVWEAPAGWPWWYALLWVGAIAGLVLARPRRAGVLTASLVAALGATTLVWANTARGRVALAQAEVAGLVRLERQADALLTRFGEAITADPPAPSRDGLLQAYVASDLAAGEYPVALAAWDASRGDTIATLATGLLPVPLGELAALTAQATTRMASVTTTLSAWPTPLRALAVPTGGMVVTAVVAPRTTLLAPDPAAQLVGADPVDPLARPYQVRVTPPGADVGGPARWTRDGSTLRGSIPLRTAVGSGRALVDVALRPLNGLLQRGALLVLMNLAIVAMLWSLTVLADGRLGRWLRARRRRWVRSFRARLSIALFGFFVVPAAVFAVWSYQQLLEDGRQTRLLLARETLRGILPGEASVHDATTRDAWIGREGARASAPLLLYVDGVLQHASDPLYVALAPTGLLLDPDVGRRLAAGDELVVGRAIADASSLSFGFRAIGTGAGGTQVLAAPTRAGDVALDRRRQDLTVLVMFAAAMGGLAALALSGLAAQQLARPVGALRSAAISVARGEREPALAGEPPDEFRPVFSAFRRMATDLAVSRAALEAAQQRTAAVLRNVGSGVVAVDRDGRVTLANPRAEALLHQPLPPGTTIGGSNDRFGLAAIAGAFIASPRDDHAFELDIDDLQLAGRLTRLGADGVVITLDDVTALARAQRVLAWGEMARQVAHEIKNPLTPIRLGVQHLRRARTNPKVDFDAVLETNVTRILGEIDRLDEIARAFSRYGSAPAERVQAEPVDVSRVAHDLAALETMGESAVRFHVEGADAPVHAMAQPGELREVLLNLVENARLADARIVRLVIGVTETEVQVAVHDDGHGIAPDVVHRVFEPHFSTRTSGSGLGLAVSRRMIEGWGGTIGIRSAPGEGTSVTVSLRAATG